MAVAELVEKVTGLSEEDRTEFFTQVLEGMSVIGVINLVKHFEEKWDVKASGGGGMMMAAPVADAIAEDRTDRRRFGAIVIDQTARE